MSHMATNLSATTQEADLRKTIAADAELLPENLALLESAIAFAVAHHEGQARNSGDPYIIHPLAVADRLHQKYGDTVLTAAALLHDTIEDCPTVCAEDVYGQFGEDIGFLVDAVTKGRHAFYKDENLIIEDRIERMLYAGQQDVRVLLLKIADRENNLTTLEHLKAHKQIRMAFETQAVYQPLKRILGYDEGTTVNEAMAAFKTYCAEGNLKTPAEVKESLITESFDQLDTDLFGLVYKDTNSIIWKITDQETYARMCDTPSFNDAVRFLSVRGNKDWFQATFQFIKGGILADDIKLGISRYRMA